MADTGKSLRQMKSKCTGCSRKGREEGKIEIKLPRMMAVRHRIEKKRDRCVDFGPQINSW